MVSTKYTSMNEYEILKILKDKIRDILSNLEIVNIKIEAPIKGGMRTDMIVEVKIGKLRKTLLMEVKYIGEPKRAKIALFQLRKLINTYPEFYPVFVAPYISVRSREICRSEGL